MASRRKSRKGTPAASVTQRAAPPAHEPAPVAGPARAAVWLRAALIVLAGSLTYANALSGPFVLDDQDTIVLNEQIRQLSPSVVLFPAVELPVAGRPVVNVSFALNYAFGGLDVRGYHVVNVAIHIACALLLFGIVRRTLGLPALRERFAARSADLAVAAALIWMVHPLQTDAVDYVTQRTELMLGLFYLLTLYASIRSVRLPASAPLALWPGLAVVSCVLGMASKESMVTAPFVILVYDRVFVFGTFKEAWRRRWPFYASLAATWVVLAVLIAQGPRFRSAGFSAGVSAWTYLLNQALMIARYLRLAIWPSGLVVDYGVPRALTVGEVAPYGALVLMLAALTVWALVSRPKVGFLGLWFFTTLSPTSSIVPIATEVGAERRMYLPLAAIVVLAVIGLAWALERWDRVGSGERPEMAGRRAHVAGLVALAGVVLALAAGTVARNREYSSAVSLARTTLERWPNPRARHSLGVALLGEGQREAGITELRQAVSDDPAAHYTLGVALFQDGKLDEAAQHLREFLARESLRIEVPVAHELVGRILKTQGRFAEAAEKFRQVLGMTPSNPAVHGLLAESLFRQERFDEAIPHYRQFLAYRPADVAAQVQLGIAYAALGRQDEAIAQFRRVVDLNPRDAVAHRNLARALLERSDLEANVDEAVLALRRAVELNPADPQARAELEAVLRR
jgi:tetratricopeptide (TPR) repeat protein